MSGVPEIPVTLNGVGWTEFQEKALWGCDERHKAISPRVVSGVKFVFTLHNRKSTRAQDDITIAVEMCQAPLSVDANWLSWIRDLGPLREQFRILYARNDPVRYAVRVPLKGGHREVASGSLQLELALHRQRRCRRYIAPLVASVTEPHEWLRILLGEISGEPGISAISVLCLIFGPRVTIIGDAIRTGNMYSPVIVDDDEQLIRAGGPAGISAIPQDQ
ncbi:hypothetical protein B0H14DRAFT_2565025 [Mycena olivaceomarginata]|nr:hypothetical protein B0H14DRAFT_2565025 [Mycena olivaceomarginata]